MRMSAEFLPLYRLCGTSISSIAHSWNGRLYSVKRFQSAYARRTMILPFSSNRSRSEEHTSELQSQSNLVCRLLLEKKKKTHQYRSQHTPYEHKAMSSLP